MGNCFRNKKKNNVNESGSVEESKSSDVSIVNQNNVANKNAPKSWELRRKNLKLEDYECKNLEKQTIIKKPGSINGEQFVIENCKDCNIYLCDNTATVLIDDCERCLFYIAPCNSSVFVRNVNSGNMIIACQQLRMKDCYDLSIMIYSQTMPTIEDTKNIKFGCFKFGYFELAQQFKKADLNVWNNRWSQIYDFTPKGAINYSYLNETIDPYSLIPRISSFDDGNFSESTYEDQVDSIVPITQGLRKKNNLDICLIMILPGYAEIAEQLVPIINHHDEIYFIQAKAVKATNDQMKYLFSDPKSFKTIIYQDVNWSKDDFTFMKLGGINVLDNINALLTNIFPNPKNYYIWKDKKEVQEACNIVFESWKEETGYEIRKQYLLY